MIVVFREDCAGHTPCIIASLLLSRLATRDVTFRPYLYYHSRNTENQWKQQGLWEEISVSDVLKADFPVSRDATKVKIVPE